MDTFEEMIESNIVKRDKKKRAKKKARAKKKNCNTQKDTTNCDRLLRWLEIKESQWYDEDYEAARIFEDFMTDKRACINQQRLENEGSDVDFEPDDTEILKLNTVRKTLYKLYSEKLAQFRRIRDKSTGWFIYYWWHEFERIEEILSKKKKLNERKLRERLQYEEENYFFTCQKCNDQNLKYIFEQAFEFNFRCPECGEPLEAQNNEEIIQFLKEKITLNQTININKDN